MTTIHFDVVPLELDVRLSDCSELNIISPNWHCRDKILTVHVFSTEPHFEMGNVFLCVVALEKADTDDIRQCQQ